MKYSIFRDMVLTKADAANVHKLNGHLGIIVNELQNIRYWEKQKKTIDVVKGKTRFIHAMNEIRKLTGEYYEYQEFE